MINNLNIIEKGFALSGQGQTGNQPSKAKWRGFARLGFLGLAVLSFSGCVGRYTGGGSIDSVAGAPQKATFGFVIDAVNPDTNGFPTAVKGQFQYDDHGIGVSFHTNLMTQADYFFVTGTLFPDFNPTAFLVVFHGTYSSAQGAGSLDVGVASHDTSDGFGDTNKDAVFVQVLTGPFTGYSNSGLVQNGTIQFRPPNSK